MPPRCATSEDENPPDIANLLAQQLQNLLPEIVNQVTANVNANANNGNGNSANGANGGNGGNGNNGCTYKSFMSCNPKEYDRKVGAVWNTQVEARGRQAANAMSWNDFKALLVEEFCPTKLVPHLVTPESARIKRYMAGLAPEIRGMLKATQPATIQSAILKAGILTDEAVSNGTLTKGSEKRKSVDEPAKVGGSGRDVKKAKGGTNFVAAAPSREGYAGSQPWCAKCRTHHHEKANCKVFQNGQRPGMIVKIIGSPAIPAAPVNAVDARPNQRACYECGDPNHLRNVCPKLNRASGQSGNQLALGWRRNDRGGGNQVRGRAYNASMNAAEAAKDSSVVTGTFSLNDHFATVLFDSGADFSFISTKFAPILNVKPSIANPGYVIEIADGKKVEVDRIIRGCKLELGSSLFTIDLIPLGHVDNCAYTYPFFQRILMSFDPRLFAYSSLIPLSCGSFDVIVGMDWLSKRKFVIVCHEKVVRIPLEGDETLQVHGDRTQGVVKTVMNKKFRVDLVPRATPVAKSPYRLAPLEMQELFEQLQELQNEEEHGVHLKLELELLRKEKLYAKKWRVKLRRVRAMSMTIQSSVKDKILATSSESSKVENTPAEMLRDLDNSKEWNSGEDQLRFRWMIYLVVLADDAESVRDAIRYDYQLSIRCAPFEALYGKKCRSPVLWAEIGESSFIGLELVQEMTDKVVLIKEKLKAARDRVILFRKKGKLAPRYVRPFEILKRIGPVAYRLRLPEELSETIENSDREVKRLKCSRMVGLRVVGYFFSFRAVLLNKLKEKSNKRARNDRLTSSEYERYVNEDFISHFQPHEFAGFDVLGFWKAKESRFPALSRMAIDLISVQANSVASESAFSTSRRVFDNQSIERDRLIGIGFVLDFVEFISFTFSDKEMILVIEAVSR
ncbi:putative reverse transcriptase domain-containing protein [Tanacetum coccineum]|uniref:Reverse transcriptase domain-containing protein n=1 Tax=Tanacetum coccineum TaxID=301880 RepID=A0ABQ5BQU1_9ASTR